MTLSGDSDFGGKEETLTFLGGAQLSNPGPFTVTITDDTVSECTERFNISYSVISSSVTGGASVRQLDSKATVVIEDNDGELGMDVRMYCICAIENVVCQL